MNCTKDNEVTGCECPTCTQGWLAYARAKRRERGVRLTAGIVDVEHGTVNSYSNYQCRCESCTEAMRVYAAKMREGRAGKDVPDRAHGTPGGYTNYGCRCVPCKQANKDYYRERKAAREGTK